MVAESNLPAPIDMVNVMIGPEETRTLNTISLSHDTIARRINAMATDVQNQIIENLKNMQPEKGFWNYFLR